MKKVFYLVLVMILAISMIACGNNGSAVESESRQEPAQNASDTPRTQDPVNVGEEDTDPSTSAENPNTPVQNSVENSGKPSIAGISLGDSVSKVEMILGENYENTLHEEMGHFGEAYFVREYEGISFIIGKDSQKVLEIDVTSDEYETWLGDKIGDSAGDVLAKYREKYTEPETIHSDGKLLGWFELGDGLVIIFDFDKDDQMIINTEINDDSKVELIKLADMRYMD